MRKVVVLVVALAAAGGLGLAARAATEAPAAAGSVAMRGVATWGEDQRIDKTKKRDEYGGRLCGTSGTWQGSSWMVLAMLGLVVRRRA